MKTIKYYTKPVEVEAIQWKGDTSFVDKFKEVFNWSEINFQLDTPNERSLVEFSGGAIRANVYIDKAWTDLYVGYGDWLVIEDGEPSIVREEDFDDFYFRVMTEIKKVMPKLEDLI